MTAKFLEIALLAVLVVCQHITAQVQKGPQDFLSEADQKLRDTFTQCQPLTSGRQTFASAGLDAKIKILSDLETCGRNLEEISQQAHQYDLGIIGNATIKQALLELGNVESALKIGSLVTEVNSMLGLMNRAFDEQTIEYFDDDQMISLKDIERIMTTSDSVDELDYYWRVSAEKVQSVAEEPFFNFIKAVKRVAKTYNLTASEFWYPDYSEAKMVELEQVIEQLKPFYVELHAYIRHKILRKFGAGVIKPTGPIPNHFYKQIQARAWSEYNKYLNDDFPFEKLPSYEQIFINSGHDPNAHTILEIAENFYESLGFDSLTQDFWQQRVIKSQDASENCRSTVHDDLPDNVTFVYCDQHDLDAFGADHEHLGRVHSALLKQKLPLYFYDNNLLGEPFGRAVKLSAFTPQHLNTIGLSKNYVFSDDVKININFRLAFETLFTLNYEYVNARLITDFLDGKVKKKHLNRYYWKLLEDYAGIEPPVDRHEDSFDLPHQLITKVMTNRNLIRDFENSILAFQFYKAACDKIGHTGHLNDCDFYNQKAVGNVFKEALSQGASKPLNELISLVSPNNKLNAEGLLAYFDITSEWLKKFNQNPQISTGWEHTGKQTFKELFRSERDALLFIKSASDKIYELFNQINEDLFLDKNQASEFADDTFGAMFWKISKSAVAARDLKDISLTAKKISASNFKDKALKRALKNLARISDIFVVGADIEDFYRSKSTLYNISTDRDIPQFNNRKEMVALYPDIRNVFLHSRNEEELKYYWEAWRESNSEWARNLLVDMFKTFKTAASMLEIPVAEFWFKHYNTKFVEKMERIILLLRPLYNSIHHYVKTRLIEKYGANILSKPNGAIPDHLIEQVLLQIWTPDSIVEKDFPFADLPPHDLFVQQQNLSAAQWLIVANQFYLSMGFENFGDDFWTERLKPQADSATATNCHANIFDMTPKTYMKYCDRVGYRKLLQAHGDMGRLHYATEKKDLPAYFFDSYYLEYPVGEAVILSASTPKHSETIKLFMGFPVTDKVLMNRNIRMAIHTLFNLHKYFVHTKVMLEYLEGEVSEEKIGKFYWRYMVKYAGIEPPLNRDENDFDFPYEFYPDLEQNHQVKKFVSEVMGYQMYEHLCKISGHTGDLNNCDFYGSTAAGDALKNMMKMGSTVPRKVVLKSFLNENGMSAQPMLLYYEPLMKWFEEQNVPKDKPFAETLRIFKG